MSKQIEKNKLTKSEILDNLFARGAIYGNKAADSAFDNEENNNEPNSKDTKLIDESKINPKYSESKNNTDLYIFTDGACSFNGSKKIKTLGGYGVYIPSLNIKISKQFTDEPTNNKVELTAIKCAFKFIIVNKLYKKYNNIYIYTDSQYSINCLTVWIKKWAANNWKSSKGEDVLNLKLIQKTHYYLTHIRKKINIEIKYIKAHTGKLDFFSKSNDTVDKLARDAIIMQKAKNNEQNNASQYDVENNIGSKEFLDATFDKQDVDKTTVKNSIKKHGYEKINNQIFKSKYKKYKKKYT